MLKFFKIFKYALAGIFICISIFLLLVFWPFQAITFPEKDYSGLIISDINIVDIKNDTILKNRHVLIKHSRIEKISFEPLEAENSQYKIIHGNAKYLIPSLWDMHVHLTKRSPHSAHTEFIVNGVMHVRDMRGAYNTRDHFASTPERIIESNQKVNDLELLGPIIHDIPSFAVEGPSPMFDKSPEYYNCSNSDQARELVNHFQSKGITFIKSYNNIPREAFFTLMEEAKLAKISVGGHKPVRVSTIEAANAGMKSLEHARFLIWDSFSGSQELRNSKNPKQKDDTALRFKMLQDHDSSLLMANLKALKDNSTYYCPTHLTRKADALADHESFRARYNHINPIYRFLAFEDLDASVQEDSTKHGRKVYYDFYSKGLEISKTANDFGIKILAGSDVPELPGTSLLDELQELSDAGLTNYEVLRTTCLHPPMYYQIEKDYGSIEEGKAADLVILTNNPIAEISNVRDIDGIIYKGVHLNKEKINILKKKIYSRNKGVLMTAKLLWDILLYITI